MIYISVIIILLIINIPYVTVESFTEKQFYTEQEPYNYTETYYEKESYTDEVPLKLNTKLDWNIVSRRFNDEFDLVADLKNIDNSSGVFWVAFHVESTNGSFDFTTDKVNLSSGETYHIEKSFKGFFSYVSYKIKQPAVEVIKIRNVPRERMATVYRDVEKSREVARERKIRLSILQRILEIPPPPEPPPPPPPVETESDDF